MDWKEQLARLNIPAGEPQPDRAEDHKPTEISDKDKTQKTPILVVYDRKGRKGKTATIAEGFEVDETEIKRIAGELKRRLATGGSVRGSDILIQGERGAEVVEILTEMGFKTKKSGF